MRKSLWIIPVLLVAIGAPNASADPVNLCAFTTTLGGDVVLGTNKPLTDSATLGRLCSYPGTLTFTLIDVFGKATSFQFGDVNSVTAMGTFPITGPIPDVAGTYKWIATYTPQKGEPVKSGFEKQVVTPEPATGALILVGIGFLLVMRKRCASGLTPIS
jgi:hypothetical protein